MDIIPEIDMLVCMPDLVCSKFVVETLLPISQDVAIRRVMFKTGQRSEYAREMLLNEFLEGPSEYVFLVDADMVIPHDVLPRLLRHRKKMICGLYFGRGERHWPVIFEPEPVDHWPKTRMFNYPQNALVEVGACGHGCLIIHRSVLEAMEKPYSLLGPFGGHEIVGSDIRLCMKARAEADIRIWCDTSVKCGHIQPMEVTESHYIKNKNDYLEQWKTIETQWEEHFEQIGGS